MQKLAEPGLLKKVQAAMDRGQVVLIGPPGPPLPPARPRNEIALVGTICSAFKLRTRRAAHVLARLLMHEHQTLEQLRDAIAPKTKIDCFRVSLTYVRKALAPHDIRIDHAHGGGFFLSKDVLEHLHYKLAKFDAEHPLKPPKPGGPRAGPAARAARVEV